MGRRLSERARPQVVIVGAGFGGLTVARRLRKAEVDVLLIDRHNYHTFQPLLYQVATAGLEPEEIAHTVRGIFHDRSHFRFRMGEVTSIDWSRRAVLLDDGDTLEFDFLVLAAGASTDYFGIDGAEEHSFELKSLGHAMRLRSHIMRQFEAADREHPRVDLEQLTFVVVGGGPTGVETSGALVELFDRVMRKDFPQLPFDRVHVVLLEASEHVLGAFDRRLQSYARRSLEKRGVAVRLGDPVIRVSPDGVHLKSGAFIPTRTVIWSAGVRASGLADALDLKRGKAGRIVVNPDLSVPGQPGVFVIGDMAAAYDGDGLLPQVAPVAMQGARHVAAEIQRTLRGEATQAFTYNDPGIMATIGRNSAVVQFPIGFRSTGFLAWLMWLGLHLIQLIGFRNRLNVLVNWAWNYFTYDRSARLILEAPNVHTQEETEPSL